MARLSFIILLLLCITITGVYATWTYAGTNDIADAYAEAKVTIEGVELTGANGIYKVESNLVLTIDQANEDHEAKLVFGSNNDEEPYLKVTFTPAANAPQAIKENAVPSEVYFTVTTTMQYDGVDIFTFSNPGNGVLDNTFTWTKESDGTFTYTMNKAELEAAISLSKTFVLDTKAEHDAFGEALAGNIKVWVTDGTVNH